MTIPPERAKLVEVTQADRDFTAQWIVIAPENQRLIRAGEWDHHHGVQATARHRLNTRTEGAIAGAGDYKLPCDVHLPPATVISAGCDLATLKLAMEVEHRPRKFDSNPRNSLPKPSPEIEGEAGETGWLIETQFGPHTHYLGLVDPRESWNRDNYDDDGYGRWRSLAGILSFKRDANDAIRFSRTEDAQQLVTALGQLLIEPKITEHMWPGQ